MGVQRDLSLRSVLQDHWLEVSQAGCDQRGGVEPPESSWGEASFSGWPQEGFLEEVAVDEDEQEFACPELWGRTFQA